MLRRSVAAALVLLLAVERDASADEYVYNPPGLVESMVVGGALGTASLAYVGFQAVRGQRAWEPARATAAIMGVVEIGIGTLILGNTDASDVDHIRVGWMLVGVGVLSIAASYFSYGWKTPKVIPYVALSSDGANLGISVTLW